MTNLQPTLDAENPKAPSVSQEQFGRYRLQGELASGGMARIYLASIEGPGGFVKPCVVKKVLPEFQRQRDFSQMFVTEAKVAALLNHPNIVQAFDFGRIGEEYFLAMEFVEGASLLDIIKRARSRALIPSLNATVTVGIALCEALAYAHSARTPEGQPLNIVHRDISPANVLISVNGGVKLADFGVVKSSAAVSNSRPDVVKGKLLYMSPEQAQRQALDGRSDLYALGLLLYELSTGRRPLARSTMAAAMHAVVTAEIAPPSTVSPDFPPQLEVIIMKLLSLDRNARYPDAKALQQDLETFRADQHWSPGTDELAGLLVSLFPEGPPSSPGNIAGSAESKLTRHERGNAAAKPGSAAAAGGQVVHVEEQPLVGDDLYDELDESDSVDVELMDEPTSEMRLGVKEMVLLVMGAVIVSLAVWLFALP